MPPESEGNFVNKASAVYVAGQFANNYGLNYQNLLSRKGNRVKTNNKIVEHVLEIKGQTKKTALYLINYANGGFAIVSGDKRAKPILAYSSKNHLPKSTSQSIPGGLAVWIGQNVHQIDKIRSSGVKDRNNRHIGWQTLLDSSKPDSAVKSKPPLPPDPCQPYYKENGPLLQTTWGQGSGYNNFAPNLGCDVPYNGRAYSGCVATAIAQVVRYHEVPQIYNWNTMPDIVFNSSSNGSDQISALMLDIADEVDMEWGCTGSDIPFIDNGSGAEDDDIDNAFHHFGYSSAHQIGYDGTAHYDDVVDEIEADRPVVFSGCDKDHIIGIFPVGRDCHAWVSDGYRESTICPSGSGYLSFYMNWGWNGSYNGWFGFNDFSPGSSGGDYNYKSEVVIGIHP